MPRLVPVEDDSRRGPRLVPVEEQAGSSAGEAFGRSAVTQFVNNALGAGELAGNAVLHSGANLLGQGNFLESSGARVNLPEAQDIEAAARAVGQTDPRQAVTQSAGSPLTPAVGLLGALGGQIRDRFGSERADIQQAEEALAQEHPFATGAGGVAGDAATLVTGRLPLARALARTGSKPATNVVQNLEPSARRAFKRFVESGPMQKLARGLGRTGETAAEGAVLAAIDDGDPLQTAIFGATGQAAGSTALTLGSVMKNNPLASLVTAAALAGGGIQLFKSATPGGRDRILESIESGFDKVMLASGAALAAGLAGAGRGRGSALAEDFPRVFESATASLRGSLLSLLKDAAREQEQGINTTERTLQHLTTDPEQFTEQQLQALEQGLRKGNLSEVAERLANEDKQFARIIDSPVKRANAQAKLRDSIRADNEGTTPTSATKVAEALGRRLPKDSSLRRTFEESGPRTFIGQVFQDQDAAKRLLPRLGKNQRRDALEVGLNQLLTRNTRQRNGQRVLDGEALERAWTKLPKATREAYPKAVRRNVEAFIAEAQANQLSALPPLAARSLMNPNGALGRRLRGESTKQPESDE